MPQSEARARATNKYNKATYDKILVRIRKDNDLISLEDLKQAVEASGESLNTYVLKAIADRMDREGR